MRSTSFTRALTATGATGAYAAATSPSTSLNAASVTVALRAARVTSVVRYAYSGGGDTVDLTLDAVGTIVEQTVGLPGGSSMTRRVGSTEVWSHPNLHGDVAATTGPSGAKIGATFTYDPYGNPLGTLPDNSAGAMDYGWLGQHQRPLEHQGGLIPIIEMGARQYDPTLGRFLQTDPIEGGSANDYDYVEGDPVNNLDLAGTYCLTGKNKNGSCRSISRGASRNAKAVVRWPTNAAGRVAGWLQGNSRRCGTGKTRCVDNARFTPGKADAWTLGNTVYCKGRCTGEIVRHEMVHVRQFQQGGVGFVAAYGWESAFGGTRCGNKYERSAYAVAMGPC